MPDWYRDHDLSPKDPRPDAEGWVRRADGTSYWPEGVPFTCGPARGWDDGEDGPF